MKFRVLLLLPLLLLISSCAKEVEETTAEIQNRVLQAWMEKTYGGALTANEDGIYVIYEEDGEGRAIIEDSLQHIYFNYTIKNLAGEYTHNDSEEYAKKTGTHTVTSTYFPTLYLYGQGATPLYETVLHGMKLNGVRECIVPVDVSGEGQNLILRVDKIEDIVDDIEQYQIDSLERYVNRCYPGLDSLEYGFYFKKILTTDQDTIAVSATPKIRYIGKLLNGYTFDTNIADTAKKYRFYSESSTYSALTSVSWKSDEDDMISESSLVEGFTKGLFRMKYGERAIVIFWSNFGYLYEAQTNIPAYSPLQFEIWIEDKEE